MYYSLENAKKCQETKDKKFLIRWGGARCYLDTFTLCYITVAVVAHEHNEVWQVFGRKNPFLPMLKTKKESAEKKRKIAKLSLQTYGGKRTSEATFC